MHGITESPARAAEKTIVLHPRNEKRSTAIAEEPNNQLEYIEQSRQAHSYSKGVQKLFDMALSYMQDAEKGNQQGRQAAWSTGLMEAPFCTHAIRCLWRCTTSGG